MKKKILMVVLMVALLGVVAGGVAYATNGHDIVSGQKLLGVGSAGQDTWEGDGITQSRYVDTQFTISNPNCEASIDITYFTILDEQGNLVVGGTPAELNEAPGAWEATYVPSELGPHEIWQFALVYFLGGAPDFHNDGYNDDWAPFYTVEITFASDGNRPLVGWFQPHFHTFTFFGKVNPNKSWESQADDVDMAGGGVQMMNYDD